MKLIFSIGFLMLSVFSVMGQTYNTNYDSTLAKELGADEYGMKNYVFVMLKTGSNKTTDKVLISNSFRGHMENIGRLVDEGLWQGLWEKMIGATGGFLSSM